jgi:CRISPR-associated protein Csb1
MSDPLGKFDAWLDDAGPAAIVLREHLVPVEGKDGVVFPATYAAGDRFEGGYNIDRFPDGTSVCLIDSVGSQANRIEPIFATSDYADLVPQVVITAGSKEVNLLEAGHRAGDAIVRCSALQEELQAAFKSVLEGDATSLARVAPTSLVFGVWDSRDTQAKLPRLLASTIRAFGVRELKRSAQYVPAVEYVDLGLLEEPADEKSRKTYSERGFVHVPASGTHGGVIADSGIRRDAILHLAALRLLRAGRDADKTRTLQRYVLGLGLTALTYRSVGYLRQGCNVVLDPGKPRELTLVGYDGARSPLDLPNGEALAYAKSPRRPSAWPRAARCPSTRIARRRT